MVDDEERDKTCEGIAYMEAWTQFLQTLETSLGKETVHNWLRPLKVRRFDARNLYLEALDSLQVEWFEEHVRPLLKTSFFNNNGRQIQIHFTEKSQTLSHKSQETSYQIAADRLDPELSFENWIVCPENKMATELLRSPLFNPIYISGPKHTGKTHLLTAAALEFQRLGKKVFYVRAETFTSHVVQAIRLGLMRQFREIYRKIDVLCIDDIDFLAGKNATQEEFFHTFNQLHTAGKQILLSSHLPPSQLVNIEPRLMSRFEWGISLAIQAPEPLLLLTKKASLWNAPYSEETLLYLAKNFSQDPLVALQALLLRGGKTSLTQASIENILQDLIEKKEPLSPEKIIEKTALYFGLLAKDLLGKSQTKEHTTPRQIAMFLCRENLSLGFQKIGDIFGKDHSTVMSSVRSVKQQLENGKEGVQEALQAIEKSLAT